MFLNNSFLKFQTPQNEQATVPWHQGKSFSPKLNGFLGYEIFVQMMLIFLE